MPSSASHLRLVPPPPDDDVPDVHAAWRLVDVALATVCRAYGVPRRTALVALLTVSRSAARPLRDVATGVLLAHRLPLALVNRLRHHVPRRPPGLAATTPAHVTARHPTTGSP